MIQLIGIYLLGVGVGGVYDVPDELLSQNEKFISWY